MRCDKRHVNPILAIEYINLFMENKFSFSVINTPKSMLTQTLPFFCVDVNNFHHLERMLKGCYNCNPPGVRYVHMWYVQVVLRYLITLYPLDTLNLKLLTFKLIT